MNLRHTPIRTKLRFVILGTCTVALLVACATLFAIQFYVFRKESRESLSSMAGMISRSIAPAVSFENTFRGEAILAGLTVKQDVVFAELVLPNDQVFADYKRGYKSFAGRPMARRVEAWNDGRYSIHAEPVDLDGQQLGTLYVVADVGAEAARLINLYLAIFCGVLTLSVLVSLLVSSRLGRLVTAPLEKLAETVRTVAGSNDYSVRAEKDADDELGSFTDSFNEMIARIQSRDMALQHEIEERERAEKELQVLHAQLVDASRQAGMAEVATGVLHNVGNVLNSVNVSATLVAEKLNIQRLTNLQRTAEMLHLKNGDLVDFLTQDPKGKLIPGYLENLSRHLVAEQQQALTELELLSRNIEHIKEIVSMQQTFARIAGETEPVFPEALIEDALRMTTGSLQRHHVEVVRDYEPCPPVQIERHKVLQILVNLIRNAKHSLDEAGPKSKIISLRLKKTSAGFASISVQDNGTGSLESNLTKIFSHGFTTRKDGHGFGLHSAALAAQQMHGHLGAESLGPGQGATFTLELPLATPKIAS
jgi:C4-dicarboxylate-specific signal transduction histidine kinase